MTQAENFVVAAAMVTEVTVPSEELRHYITDDELDKVGEMKGDFVRELFWASLGACAGSVTAGITAFKQVGDAAHPLGWAELSAILILALSLGSMLLAGALSRQREHGRKALLNRIKGRERVRVLPHQTA
jgi:hypothetical protein